MTKVTQGIRVEWGDRTKWGKFKMLLFFVPTSPMWAFLIALGWISEKAPPTYKREVD